MVIDQEAIGNNMDMDIKLGKSVVIIENYTIIEKVTSELGYDEGDDPKNWNLPMSGSSIKGGYPSDSMLNKSNFCVVFNLYEFMNKPNKKDMK